MHVKHKFILFIVNLIILQNLSFAVPMVIPGDEAVVPIKYPKFSITATYSMARRFYGFADKNIHFGLFNQLGGILSFEAGLYNYFNAGAQLSFGIPKDFEEPIHLALSLFMKPYVPLGKCSSFFSRIGGGISGSQGGMQRWLSKQQTLSGTSEIRRIFPEGKYYNTSFGGNFYINIGLEYFPWPLFGFALEGGVRAEIWRERGLAEKNPEAPRNFDYITYEFPLGITVQIIL
jgi:hypothetical protein